MSTLYVHFGFKGVKNKSKNYYSTVFFNQKNKYLSHFTGLKSKSECQYTNLIESFQTALTHINNDEIDLSEFDSIIFVTNASVLHNWITQGGAKPPYNTKFNECMKLLENISDVENFGVTYLNCVAKEYCKDSYVNYTYESTGENFIDAVTFFKTKIENDGDNSNGGGKNDIF